MAPLDGGHPVVYGILVEEHWFGGTWQRQTGCMRWERRPVDMRSDVPRISPGRLVAKAVYPNGTDPHFTAAWCTTWEQAASLGLCAE